VSYVSRAALAPMSRDEVRVIERLIREADETIADMETVLDPDEVTCVRHARDWLRGVRDSRTWTTPARPDRGGPR
jgi:hypothetical protein